MLGLIIELTERSVRDVLGNQTPWFALGEEHLPKPGGCPAVIWVPGRGPINGGRQAIDQSQEGQPGNINPPGIFQRNLAVNAYIFDAEFRATEKLFGHVVAGLQKAAAGRWTPTGESWSIGWPVATEEPRKDFESGTLLIFTFDLRMPLTREPDTDLIDLDLSLTGNVEQQEFPG